jgi:phosphoribosylglycinamide formyltransferase-1
MPEPIEIAVLISGGGTTLKNLIERCNTGKLSADICNVISNNPNAGGIQFANDANIPVSVINHRDFDSLESFSNSVFDQIRESGAKLVVMGGFLRRLLIAPDFENRVINIHPSLIPAFCGKGNYGSRVHNAVLEYGCKLTGCTVHFVDDHYDHGPIIAQRSVPVQTNDTFESLAARVFVEECELLPDVINLIAADKVRINGRAVEIDGTS